MATAQYASLDFVNSNRILNLPDGINPQEPATMAQLASAIEGLKPKLPCYVSTQGNINLSAPGDTIDGQAMSLNKRVLARLQTDGSELGIYLWNGASTVMTRALDANTATELAQAIVTVESGTDAGKTFRQTVSNATLGTTALNWTPFGTVSSPATETNAGVIEIATQAEMDTGTDDLRAATPFKVASSPFAHKGVNATIGDGSATSFQITHNFGTRDVNVSVYRNSGNYDTVGVDVHRTSTSAVTIVFTGFVPAVDAFRVTVTKN